MPRIKSGTLFLVKFGINGNWHLQAKTENILLERVFSALWHFFAAGQLGVSIGQGVQEY